MVGNASPAPFFRYLDISLTYVLFNCLSFQIKCHHYWPTEGSRLYGVILVELIEETSFGDYSSRKFKLTHTEVT